jgi:signal transduction histidine kinase
MSTADRAQRLAVEAIERRVLKSLAEGDRTPAARRSRAVVGAAAVLFALTFAARLAVHDPSALIANFYTVPIALLAIVLGLRAGLVAAGFALALVYAWGAIQTVHVGVLGYVSRGSAFLMIGGVVGHFSERLRRDITERRHAQRQLALYADELARSNEHLARSVVRLEAFAHIARAVGGETDLERVLALILEHGREIIGARGMLVCLPEGDELVVVAGRARTGTAPLRLPGPGSLAGEVLATGTLRRATDGDEGHRLAELSPGARAAILAPIIFRGETLGVLAGIDQRDGRPFDQEDEQLLLSVAASAATAVATARSVAADRLRLSLEAGEQARGRWARELHDETLQGLSGVRMLLSAALARDDLAALRGAAETADDHLAGELRRLRDLITELRPAALDDLGLGPAIETLAERHAASGGFTVLAEVELEASQRPARDTESTIYRLVQEALTNAAKHAAASHVLVSVTGDAAGVEIRVEDDGQGFDPDSAREGFGLMGMRERATLAGGRLTVSSCPGGPTRVTAVLPVPG